MKYLLMKFGWSPDGEKEIFSDLCMKVVCQIEAYIESSKIKEFLHLHESKF